MKPLSDWTAGDFIVFTIGLAFLALLCSIVFIVLSTLMYMILAFAGTGFGAIVITIAAIYVYKRWIPNRNKETK